MIKRGPKPNHEAQAAKYGKNCKACGTWFVNRDRYYCSTECRKSVVAKPVEFTCQHCGKRGTRDPHGIKNINRMFCNKECQNAFQRNHYRIYQPNSKKADSGKRSANAKKRWFSERRKQRKMQSIEYAWWKKFKSSLACTARLEARSGWDRKCASASSILKKRREPVFKLQKQFALDWDAVIRDNRKRLRIDKRSKEEIEWAKKINHTVRACKRRLAARNKSDTGRSGMSIMETQQGWLPFAE